MLKTNNGSGCLAQCDHSGIAKIIDVKECCLLLLLPFLIFFFFMSSSV